MLIGVVAMLVLGPERLPETARSIGKGIAELRRAVEPARSAWTDLSSSLTESSTPKSSVVTTYKPIPLPENPEGNETVPAVVRDDSTFLHGPLSLPDEVADPQGRADLLSYPSPHGPVEAPLGQETAEPLDYPAPR